MTAGLGAHSVGPVHSCDRLLSVSSRTMSPLHSVDKGAALLRRHTDGEQSSDWHNDHTSHTRTHILILLKKTKHCW